MEFYLKFSRTGKSWKKTKGPGNMLNSSNKVFRIYVMGNVCRPQGELILKSWEWKGLRQNLVSWKNQSESWKSP